MIPDGLLVFFPSYAWMDSCLAHWKQMGVWERLNNWKGAIHILRYIIEGLFTQNLPTKYKLYISYEVSYQDISRVASGLKRFLKNCWIRMWGHYLQPGSLNWNNLKNIKKWKKRQFWPYWWTFLFLNCLVAVSHTETKLYKTFVKFCDHSEV